MRAKCSVLFVFAKSARVSARVLCSAAEAAASVADRFATIRSGDENKLSRFLETRSDLSPNTGGILPCNH